MGKKNLEELFKESFQDFQEVPDDKVWASIEASLDKKKQKKRAVPIWWGLGGAAAALVIALLAINPFGQEQEQEQIITDTENSAVPESRTNSEEEINRDLIPPTIHPNGQNSLADTSEEDSSIQKSNQAADNGFGKTKASNIGNTISTSNSNASNAIAQVTNSRSKEAERISTDDEGAKNNSAIAMNDDRKESYEKQSTKRDRAG